MFESGIELLRTILFARDREGCLNLVYLNNQDARIQAANALGRIATEAAISILREYLESNDGFPVGLLPAVVDAYGWALEQFHEQNRPASGFGASATKILRQENPFQDLKEIIKEGGK